MERRNGVKTMKKSNESRGSITAVNLLVTCAFLIVAVGLSGVGADFVVHLNKIRNHLDRIMEEESINYTDIDVNITYNSSTTFNPRGMGGLYNLTNAFIKLVLPEVMPEGLIYIEDNSVKIAKDIPSKWPDLLKNYAGLLTVVVITVVLALLMPFCGLCFCCCRCCGKCGARSQPYDKKHDFCKKFCLATILICLGTLLLFGVVCAFVSNQHMEDGLQELPDNLRLSIKDSRGFLNGAIYQIDILFKTNFDEFKQQIENTLNRSAEIVMENLEDVTNAVSIQNISDITGNLTQIRSDYNAIKNKTVDLRIYSYELNDAVRKIKKDLLNILMQCDKLEKCRKMSNEVNDFQTQIDYNRLPDITDKLKELDGLLNKNFSEITTEGLKKLEDTKEQIRSQMTRGIREAKANIDKAGNQVANKSDEVIKKITQLSDQLESIDDGSDSYLQKGEKYLNEYSKYRYYVGFGISCILLVVTVFITLGLICGICGKRPDVYGDDCCNKGAGSRFLICGVLVMFFFTILIAVTVLVYFLVGALGQRAVCETFRNRDNKIFDEINKVNLKQIGVNTNIGQVLDNCRKNFSIYEAFELQQQFKIDTDSILKQVNDAISQITEAATNINFTDFTILTDDQEEQLRNLAKSDFVNFNFGQIIDELSVNFTNKNFSKIEDDLQKLINYVSSVPEYGDIREQLEAVKRHIEIYQERIVRPMFDISTSLKDTAMRLQEELKLGHASFSEGMMDLINQVDKSQNQLNENGTIILKEIVIDFENAVMDKVSGYLWRVGNKTQKDLGRCHPLTVIIDGALTSTCDKILLPLNGYWFGLFWSMIIFIPTIIVSVKLANLYQKHSPYSGHLSLESRSKGKKKKRKGKRYEEGPPVPSANNGRGDYAGGNHQDARYADMAPKFNGSVDFQSTHL